MNYGIKENLILIILRYGGAGLFLDYQNQKSGNWDKKPLNVFSWVKLNTTRVVGS
jgi:hypothetical protein